MSNIMDYIDWRGDISFENAALNEVDSLIFSQLIYINIKSYMPDEHSPKLTVSQLADMYFADNHDAAVEKLPNLFRNAALMLKKMANSKRYKDCVLSSYVRDISKDEQSQFSAITIEISDNKAFISYSGTDHSVVGWKENFNLSYLSKTPGQMKAKQYLERIADRYTGGIWVGGHSKGGNLAVFAAMHADKQIQQQIIQVYNYDGPGFNNKMISEDGYSRIRSKISTFLPQSSVVGILLEHVEDYDVIKSNNTGPLQHDVFSWEILGPKIIKGESLAKNSIRLDRTLRTWISGMDEAQRKEFVDVLFSIAEESNFEDLDQMSFKQLRDMIKAADELSKEDFNILKNTIRQLIHAGVGVVREGREHDTKN